MTGEKLVDSKPCRGCGAQVVWLRTAAGKAMPVDAATARPDDRWFDAKVHTSHFATCPNADRFRRKR